MTEVKLKQTEVNESRDITPQYFTQDQIVQHVMGEGEKKCRG